ncbi:MAG: 4-hydroxy-tetrahydrodipicolinate synthase [Holosporaceae bacterium]|jgi:4-hydroxy-tetrahydrodipicolinate synthase|nr:4-hydroxy-tetrahydrodipicolinate synthase [Holosporaceae bacterium]
MLDGYSVAVVTPFKDGEVDVKSFETHVNYLMLQGISAVVICGSTGESLALSPSEKLQLIRVAAETVGGKIPVVASVIEPMTDNCLEFMRKSEKFVDGFSCVCPFYVKPSPPQIFSHFKTLSEATSKGIIVYNNPNRTGVNLNFDTFRRLCDLKNIVAIKECAQEPSRFVLWRTQAKENFSFLSGDDEAACGALAMGASGIISVSANVIPGMCVEMYRAFRQNDLKRFGALRDAMAPLHHLMFAEPSPAPAKYALHRLGFMADELRAPLTPISESLRKEMHSLLLAMGIL